MVGWNYRTWAQSKYRGDTLNVITAHWLRLLLQKHTPYMLLTRNDRLSKMSRDFKRRPENAEWVYLSKALSGPVFRLWVSYETRQRHCDVEMGIGPHRERTGFWGQYNWTSLALNGMLVAICGGEHRQSLYYQIIICHFDRLGCKGFAMIYFKLSLFYRKWYSVYKT